jgi:hypothetical protein
MPRGSKPGERRGGRQRGTPNKKAVYRNAAIAAVASNPSVSPLEFLLSTMRDSHLPFGLRIRVAQMAAPFVHPKPRSTGSVDQAGSGELIDSASLFNMDPALAKRLRDDDVRLHELFQKEVNPKERGGPLTAADEQERVMLRARVDETVKALRCPPGYGAVEARKDRHRLEDFLYKRSDMRRRGGTLMQYQISRHIIVLRPNRLSRSRAARCSAPRRAGAAWDRCRRCARSRRSSRHAGRMGVGPSRQ